MTTRKEAEIKNNGEENSALHDAVKDNDISRLADLLTHGARTDTKDHFGNTALHIATMTGTIECIALLLDHQASLTATNNQDRTPLHTAIIAHRTNVAELLLNRIENEAERKAYITANCNSYTALLLAASNSNIAMMRLFLNNGADVNETHGETFYTAVHYAVINNRPDIIKFLHENGAVLNAGIISHIFKTPLQLAASTKYKHPIEAVEQLLELGADPNEGTPPPLNYIARNLCKNSLKLVKLLCECERGANKNDFNIADAREMIKATTDKEIKKKLESRLKKIENYLHPQERKRCVIV